MRRLAFLLLTGTALCGAYAGYAALVVPLVRVPVRTAEVPAESHVENAVRPAEHTRISAQWLHAHDWTASAKYLLRTDDMFIFANEWTPQGDQGQIRFRPFAAVWLSEDKSGSEQAVTLSSESALLKFQSGFQLDNPKPGRVTGGTLNGDVQITGPDGLDLRGQNFHFSEATRSIFSHAGTTFRFGENHGQAEQMTIHLLKSEGVVPKDRPNVVGVESVELRKNVLMHLKLDNDSQTQPIQIKCTGKFEYRVESRTAVYEKDVVAFRRSPDSPAKMDWLRCDKLTAQFEPKLTAKTVTSSSRPQDDEFQKLDRNLQFRSLKAEGKPVFIGSHEQELEAQMTQLTYDVVTKTLELSAPTGTPDEAGVVHVKQKFTQLQCPLIRLVLGEKNSLESAVCQGTGWLENYDEKTGELAFAADWIKELRKTRDSETQLDLVELEQDASFRQPSRDTALGADLIRLWFVPPEPSSEKSGSSRLIGQSSNPEPKRLLAVKNVALISPQLEAEAGEHLEVLFEESATGTSSPATPVSRRPSRNPPQFTAAKGGQAPAALASIPPEKSGGFATEKARLPMVVSADTIRVMMKPPTSAEKTPDVSQIWINGHVTVEQPATDGGPPTLVTGERMHVEAQSETEQIVHVYGDESRPAHIRNEAQKLHIEGHTIHLDRAENLAWVEGRGLLQMPVNQTLDGRELKNSQLLDVWWQDRMDFDGLMATFEGDVRAKLDEGTMRCESMQVALTRRVSFTEEQPKQKAVEIHSVTCREGVEFRNLRNNDDGLLMEIQQAKVFEFHLDNTTQTTTAQGPGWMQMWRREAKKRKGLAVTESVQANRVSTEVPTEWEYFRVDFAGKMTGQTERRRTTFQDRISVVYGPVQKPTDSFDRHHLPADGGWMGCETLQVAQTVIEEKPCVQLLGAGNTRILGRGFEGRADQINYDESKGKFVLRSLGERKATIWRGKNGGEQHAQQMEFVPASNQVFVTHATSGEVTE